MKLLLKGIIIPVLTFSSVASQIDGAYTFYKGRLVDVSEAPTMSVEDHFKAGSENLVACNWKEAMINFNIIAINFPESPYATEASYYLGISYFYLKEYEYANTAFSNYLQGALNLK